MLGLRAALNSIVCGATVQVAVATFTLLFLSLFLSLSLSLCLFSTSTSSSPTCCCCFWCCSLSRVAVNRCAQVAPCQGSCHVETYATKVPKLVKSASCALSACLSHSLAPSLFLLGPLSCQSATVQLWPHLNAVHN